MRINRYIAQNTQYSRRQADSLIEKKKVFLNGSLVLDFSTQVEEGDTVTISRKPIVAKKAFTYIALHKPKNFITTRKDELNRKTVMDLAPKGLSLKPIGRLDKDSEGLLLLSNDGDLINKITHPRYQCEKEYFVTIKGLINEEEIEILKKGMFLDGKKAKMTKIKVIPNVEEKEETTNLKITLQEGKNRQIRRMFAKIEKPVKYLRRIRIANISISGIKKGEYRNLTQKEINDLKSI
jgi:23S rRNA pseudouridine2605 synthase